MKAHNPRMSMSYSCGHIITMCSTRRQNGNHTLLLLHRSVHIDKCKVSLSVEKMP